MPENLPMRRGLRVYLAGPDVFLPDPIGRGARLREVCARHGLCGVFPLDVLEDEPSAWTQLLEWQRIALRNEAHIRSCDALIANLTPFRGPSADVGTVFELGFMRALGRPVFGWSNTSVAFADRVRAASAGPSGRDADGMAIEAFGCADNLMIDGAIRASGGVLLRADPQPALRWLDLAAFERCVDLCAALLAG